MSLNVPSGQVYIVGAIITCFSKWGEKRINELMWIGFHLQHLSNRTLSSKRLMRKLMVCFQACGSRSDTDRGLLRCHEDSRSWTSYHKVLDPGGSWFLQITGLQETALMHRYPAYFGCLQSISVVVSLPTNR